MTPHKTHDPSIDRVGMFVDCEAEHRITKTIDQILESLSNVVGKDETGQGHEWFGGGKSSRPQSAAMINNKDHDLSGFEECDQ
jgi:hypothetical protein